MLPDFKPAPVERRRRRNPEPEHESADESSELLVGRNLFSSLVAGPGVMASLSAAAGLQAALPALRIGGFPLAGLVGLLTGWVLMVPVARQLARRLNPARVGSVMAVALLMGLLCATPAAFFAPAIGWLGGAVRLYIIAGVLSASGLIWGGYLNFDGPLGT